MMQNYPGHSNENSADVNWPIPVLLPLRARLKLETLQDMLEMERQNVVG